MSPARPDTAPARDRVSVPVRPPPALATITDASSFARLGDDWDDLVHAMPRPTPYLLHGWLFEWWKHYGGARELRVQVAWRDGRLTGALPLCLRRWRGLGVLEFMGGGSSALADLLLADGEEAALGAALAERGAHSGQHFAQLFGLPGGSRLAAALGPAGLRLVPRVEAPVLDLSPGWEAVYEAKTSAKRRSLHRRRRNQLAALGEGDLFEARTEPELLEALEHAFVLYERRWRGRPDQSDFLTPTGRQFERAVVVALAPHGIPRIVLLRVDGRPVAFCYYLALAGRMFAHKLAFDPAFGRCSPGVTAVLDTLALASEQGVKTVEFLGGAERFKVELADRFDPLYEGFGLARGLRGHALSRGRVAWTRGRLRVKSSPTAHWLYYRGLGPARRVLADLTQASAGSG
jgi:CelD/BcsL family acetyltransferase involved in cellulose biosynthesis